MRKGTVLVTGSSGFIGSSFIEADRSRMGITMICPQHGQMDISDKSSVQKIINKHRPDAIINFAAHRNANTAETQRDLKNASAWITNVVGVENLANFSKKHGIYMIHISTDMVFSGRASTKGPYSEGDIQEDNPDNLTWYGWTKRLAEKEILSKKINSAIIRIGNVTKPIYNPHLDYIGKILWLYDNKQSYPLFHDQNITLTHILELEEVIEKLLTSRRSGIFHVASRDLVTPFQLAEYLVLNSRRKRGVVKKTSIDKFLKIVPNRYPKYGGLKSELTQRRLGIKFKSWQEIANCFIEHINDQKKH